MQFLTGDTRFKGIAFYRALGVKIVLLKKKNSGWDANGENRPGCFSYLLLLRTRTQLLGLQCTRAPQANGL